MIYLTPLYESYALPAGLPRHSLFSCTSEILQIDVGGRHDLVAPSQRCDPAAWQVQKLSFPFYLFDTTWRRHILLAAIPCTIEQHLCTAATLIDSTMFPVSAHERFLAGREPTEEGDALYAESLLLQYPPVKQNEGEAFVRGLVEYLELDGKMPSHHSAIRTRSRDGQHTDTPATDYQVYNWWPDCMIRMYKEAGKTFLKNLYTVSSDLFPSAAFDEMARARMESWEGDEEGGEFWAGVDLLRGEMIVLMVDAVDMRSSPSRIRPEMVLALATEVAGRILVDDWYGREAARYPYDARAHRRRRSHERHTEMLSGVLEILRPEYERWHDVKKVSLPGVAEEMRRLYDGPSTTWDEGSEMEQ